MEKPFNFSTTQFPYQPMGEPALNSVFHGCSQDLDHPRKPCNQPGNVSLQSNDGRKVGHFFFLPHFSVPTLSMFISKEEKSSGK